MLQEKIEKHILKTWRESQGEWKQVLKILVTGMLHFRDQRMRFYTVFLTEDILIMGMFITCYHTNFMSIYTDAIV
jgi:hypothetical protein